MLKVQTRKPLRTFNHSANIHTDIPTPNSMMTRVLDASFQPLTTENSCFENYATIICSGIALSVAILHAVAASDLSGLRLEGRRVFESMTSEAV
jgi:hypothetical protein